MHGKQTSHLTLATISRVALVRKRFSLRSSTRQDEYMQRDETRQAIYIYIYGHTVIQDVVYLLSAQCELQRSELWHAQMSSIVCQPGLQILENWSHWVFQMFYLFFIWFFQMSIALWYEPMSNRMDPFGNEFHRFSKKTSWPWSCIESWPLDLDQALDQVLAMHPINETILPKHHWGWLAHLINFEDGSPTS